MRLPGKCTTVTEGRRCLLNEFFHRNNFKFGTLYVFISAMLPVIYGRQPGVMSYSQIYPAFSGSASCSFGEPTRDSAILDRLPGNCARLFFTLAASGYRT